MALLRDFDALALLSVLAILDNYGKTNAEERQGEALPPA
jgi:hypothetical protein